MSSYSKSELAQLKIIEDEINRYLYSPDHRRNQKFDPSRNTSLTRVLKLVLENALLPSKTVNIVWNTAAKTAFIMSITPSIQELHNKSQEFMKIMDQASKKSTSAKNDFLRKWAEIKTWYIEIDTRILSSGNTLCVENGSQFVALLCHEVGHVMIENPLSLFYNYQTSSLRFSTMERMMLSKSAIVRSLILPMFVQTAQFMIILDNIHDGQSKEKAADRYVPDEYKGELVSYMENHILLDPDVRRLIMDKSIYDKEQEVAIRLPVESILLLKNRVDALNQQIHAQYNCDTGSKFQQKLMQFIGRQLSGYNPETDKSINTYLYQNKFDREFALESTNADRVLMEASRVTPRELDILAIQVDDIETSEDRMYLLHKTYDYMEAIQCEIDKTNKKRKTITNTYNDKRLDQLKDIRKKIMLKDVDVQAGFMSRNQHSIIINYPKGYEG